MVVFRVVIRERGIQERIAGETGMRYHRRISGEEYG